MFTVKYFISKTKKLQLATKRNCYVGGQLLIMKNMYISLKSRETLSDAISLVNNDDNISMLKSVTLIRISILLNILLLS